MEKYRSDTARYVEISKKFYGFIVQNGEFFIILKSFKKDLL